VARRPGVTPAGDQRRAQILDKAEDLIDQDGFRDMTMDGIAESIGVAKSTLYHYFRSKEDILFTIHETTMAEAIRRHTERAEAGDPPLQVLEGSLHDMMEIIALRPGRAHVLYERNRSQSAAHEAVMKRSERDYEDRIAATVRSAIERGECEDLDPYLVVRAMIGMASHSRFWFHAGGRIGHEELAAMFWRILRHGTAPPSPAVSG
jgi:AcrR family transcriptional regulator